MKTVTRMSDNKGRVTLGAGLANRLVSVDQVNDCEFVVRLVRAIPESEAWLYENPAALASVRKGLQQARAGRTVKGPDVRADNSLAEELEG